MFLHEHLIWERNQYHRGRASRGTQTDGGTRMNARLKVGRNGATINPKFSKGVCKSDKKNGTRSRKKVKGHHFAWARKSL